MSSSTAPYTVNSTPRPRTPTTSGTSTNDDDYPSWFIPVVVAGSVGFLLLVLIIILYCRWKKGAPPKKIQPQAGSPIEEEVHKPRVSAWLSKEFVHGNFESNFKCIKIILEISIYKSLHDQELVISIEMPKILSFFKWLILSFDFRISSSRHFSNFSFPFAVFCYTAISIKVVPRQSGKVEYERERLLGIANNTFPLCSGDNLNWNSCIQYFGQFPNSVVNKLFDFVYVWTLNGDNVFVLACWKHQ